MKRIIIFGLGLLLFSCTEKEILLPSESKTIVADVKNYSSVYFFFKAEEKDTLVEINQSSTAVYPNLVFHIDRRLPLRKAILEVKRLQNGKNNKHEKYFAYTDTIKKKEAFLPLTTKYKLEVPDGNIMQFYFDRNDLVHCKDEVFSKSELQSFLYKMALNHPSGIVFSYDKGMSFGKYIEYQFFVKNLIIPKVIVVNQGREYIY